MAKLGYTWYPKDWGNSESVFELSLSERGLYREFIDLAMLNDNKNEIKKEVWVRKFCVSIDELNSILSKLLDLKLIEFNGNNIFIPSCEPRLNLVRGGSNGGKKSKPNIKPIPKPIESLCEINEKPMLNQREIETKIKKESNLTSLSTRSLDFKNTLVPFKSKYSIKMLESFYNYWTEPNKSQTKMRFELEKTWSITLRLETWAKRDKDFAPKQQLKQDRL